VHFLRFSRKRQDKSAPIFSWFKRKHLFITTALKSNASGLLGLISLEN